MKAPAAMLDTAEPADWRGRSDARHASMVEACSKAQHATWEGVRDAWAHAQRMGWEAVLAAAHVGAMLIELKEAAGHGEFLAKASHALHSPNKKAASVQASALMTLARHLPLLERHKPDSQRAALALIQQENPPIRAARAPAAPKPEADDAAPDVDEMKPPSKQVYIDAFLLRAQACRDAAFYAGPTVTSEMVESARACAAAWNELALHLEDVKREERARKKLKAWLVKKLGHDFPDHFDDEGAAAAFVEECRPHFRDDPTKREELFRLYVEQKLVEAGRFLAATD